MPPIKHTTVNLETFETDVILLNQKLQQCIPDEWIYTMEDKLCGFFIPSPYNDFPDGYLIIATRRCKEIEAEILRILRKLKPEWKENFYTKNLCYDLIYHNVY